MKKIVFSGIHFATHNTTGIARHTFELLKELDKIALPGQIEILAPQCEFDEFNFNNIRLRKIGRYGGMKNEKANKVSIYIWKYIMFPLYCLINNAFTVNTGLTWKYYHFDAISIYDCTPELFYKDSLYSSDWTLLKKVVDNQKSKIRTCKLVLTDSFSAKEDICKFYDVPEEKVEVIPCGWQHFERLKEDEAILNKIGLVENKYYFALGSRMPHKNIKWISCAAKKHPSDTFVVTGLPQGAKDTNCEGNIPDNMIFTGFLKDEEIKALMHYCKAFIQPSFYEGFGIPPLEAMSVGADCIVSNTGSLPEIYKNSVWYIDPYDYEIIDLDEIMSRPKESNDLILKEYSWEKSAKKLLEVLRKWTE